ncbi:WD40 repeat protein [Thermosporothrix hazakensis]|uniref:WD40 repeat protein n=3 Tax=Thermosporothrix TaxID=768650 RepID=A0A326UAW4_THEHA|nr:WD40 repeat protein [Thermosporothrix hazakensis]BBH85519.1 hypothetical protein KTC_02700 [Thermosporothrix sp. COM3]GCE46054.1 hypothetical protein KTH_09230 [Thermosporothrix hazakensis]
MDAMNTDNTALQPGQRLGEYRLLRQIGKGGFSDVYEGEHLHTGQRVAVKVLHARLTDAEDIKSFIREARIMRLNHPHILQIFDFDVTAENIPIIIMQYAANGTLRQRYRPGTRVPLHDIVSSISQVASALQYAHDRRLIHRDVKPENMLLDEANNVLLSDFGIVTTAHSTRSTNIRDNMAGTISYMAPEQIEGKPSPASDQYALAITAYEWLCGRRPFQGTITEVITQQRVAPPPPPRDLVPDLPEAVEQVLLKALAKAPEERFSRIENFAQALAQAASSTGTLLISSSGSTPHFTEQPITTHPSIHTLPTERYPITPQPVPQKQSRRLFLLGGIGAAVIVGGGAAALWASNTLGQQARVQPTRTPLSPTPSPTQKATTQYPIPYSRHRDRVKSIAWLPDSKHIVSASNDKTVQVWDFNYKKTEERPITHRGGDAWMWAVSLSPDGKQIAAADFEGVIWIWKTEEETAPLRTIHTQPASWLRALAWSPDGRLLLAGGNDKQIRLWDPKTGKRERVYAEHKQEVFSAVWSPDGSLIASTGKEGSIRIWEARTGKTRHVFTGHKGPVECVSWSHDGTRLVTAGDDKTIKIWNASTGKVLRTITGHTGLVTSVAWSPDGTRIVSGSYDNSTRVWEASTGQKLANHYLAHTKPVLTVAWSPDGNYIASGGIDQLVYVWAAP